MTSKKERAPAERLENVRFSPIRTILEKAREMERTGGKVISFGVGEPDFPTPAPIKQATAEALAHDRTHYSSNRGVLELRQEISGLLKRSTGLTYDPVEEILVTTGGAEAIHHAFTAFLDPGDEVIIPTPAFVNYENAVRLCGAVPVLLPLRPERRLQLDVQDLAARVGEKTRMIVINNPCNPTGAVYTREQLEGVCRLARDKGLFVFADEIYNRLIYEGEFHSVASFPGMKEHTLLMNGFSKTYAMTGWRVGYLAVDKRWMGPLLKVHQYTTTSGNTFVQEGTAKGLKSPETEAAVQEMLHRFAIRRDLVLQCLEDIRGLSYIRPDGAFYILVNVAATGMTGEEFSAALLDEGRVATIPAVGFGAEFGDYIRLSFATSDDDIRQGFVVMKEFVEKRLR